MAVSAQFLKFLWLVLKPAPRLSKNRVMQNEKNNSLRKIGSIDLRYMAGGILVAMVSCTLFPNLAHLVLRTKGFLFLCRLNCIILGYIANGVAELYQMKRGFLPKLEPTSQTDAYSFLYLVLVLY